MVVFCPCGFSCETREGLDRHICLEQHLKARPSQYNVDAHGSESASKDAIDDLDSEPARIAIDQYYFKDTATKGEPCFASQCFAAWDSGEHEARLREKSPVGRNFFLDAEHTKKWQAWYYLERGDTDNLKVEASLLRWEAEATRAFESDLAGLFSEVSRFQDEAGRLEVAERHADALVSSRSQEIQFLLDEVELERVSKRRAQAEATELMEEAHLTRMACEGSRAATSAARSTISELQEELRVMQVNEQNMQVFRSSARDELAYGRVLKDEVAVLREKVLFANVVASNFENETETLKNEIGSLRRELIATQTTNERSEVIVDRARACEQSLNAEVGSLSAQLVETKTMKGLGEAKLEQTYAYELALQGEVGSLQTQLDATVGKMEQACIREAVLRNKVRDSHRGSDDVCQTEYEESLLGQALQYEESLLTQALRSDEEMAAKVIFLQEELVAYRSKELEGEKVEKEAEERAVQGFVLKGELSEALMENRESSTSMLLECTEITRLRDDVLSELVVESAVVARLRDELVLAAVEKREGWNTARAEEARSSIVKEEMQAEIARNASLKHDLDIAQVGAKRTLILQDELDLELKSMVAQGSLLKNELSEAWTEKQKSSTSMLLECTDIARLRDDLLLEFDVESAELERLRDELVLAAAEKREGWAAAHAEEIRSSIVEEELGLELKAEVARIATLKQDLDVANARADRILQDLDGANAQADRISILQDELDVARKREQEDSTLSISARAMLETEVDFAYRQEATIENVARQEICTANRLRDEAYRHEATIENAARQELDTANRLRDEANSMSASMEEYLKTLLSREHQVEIESRRKVSCALLEAETSRELEFSLLAEEEALRQQLECRALVSTTDSQVQVTLDDSAVVSSVAILREELALAHDALVGARAAVDAANWQRDLAEDEEEQISHEMKQVKAGEDRAMVRLTKIQAAEQQAEEALAAVRSEVTTQTAQVVIQEHTRGKAQDARQHALSSWADNVTSGESASPESAASAPLCEDVEALQIQVANLEKMLRLQQSRVSQAWRATTESRVEVAHAETLAEFFEQTNARLEAELCDRSVMSKELHNATFDAEDARSKALKTEAEVASLRARLLAMENSAAMEAERLRNIFVSNGVA